MATDTQSRRKRNYGTGGLRQIGGSWYGTWRDPDGHKIQRKIGTVRTAGKADGIPKVEAERRLAVMRQETGRVIRLEDRVTIEVAQAADIRNHIAPFFGKTTIDKIKPRDIESYIASKQDTLAIKTIRNHVNTMHSIFELGMRQEWCVSNPVKLADRPTGNGSATVETGIRFLDQDELEKLLAGPYPDDAWGSIEPTLYLTAAMSGLRQGELIALRWRDVDFDARRIRVAQNYVRRKFDKPKFTKSARSVPMASRVEQELLRLKGRTDFALKDDLVFCHPDTGGPLDRSKLTRRFKQALKRAEVHEITFHELRHTFGTRMAAAGQPMRKIQEWMGHDDIKTTQVYTHYQPSEGEADAIDRAFA